jgi:SAM-dependent methyltransferase
MIRFGQARFRDGEREARPALAWVRGFAEALPFRAGAFDAVLCKGALDHFLSPRAAMEEIARVLRPGGRLVIALANYDSLSCRLGRARDRRRVRGPAGRDSAERPRARPYHEPPPDHLTRFGHRQILALARPPLRLTRVEGLSLLWLYPPWSALLARLPGRVSAALLTLAFALGRAIPSWSDVILLRASRGA